MSLGPRGQGMDIRAAAKPGAPGLVRIFFCQFRAAVCWTGLYPPELLIKKV